MSTEPTKPTSPTSLVVLSPKTAIEKLLAIRKHLDQFLGKEGHNPLAWYRDNCLVLEQDLKGSDSEKQKAAALKVTSLPLEPTPVFKTKHGATEETKKN